MKTFYAPTFLDNSVDRKGKPTGRLSGFVFTRSFYRDNTGKKIKASRGVIPFSWEKDTKQSKAAALRKVIAGMKEMPKLDQNPPLDWVPKDLDI